MRAILKDLAERAVRDARGAALVEAALVIPILLVLGLGAIELGHLIYQVHLVKCSLRDGARYLAYVPKTQRNKEVAGLSSHLTYEHFARAIAIDGLGSNQKLIGWTSGSIAITYRTITSPQAEVIRFETSLTPRTLGLFPALLSVTSGFYGKAMEVPRLNVTHEEVALDD